jgi:hypothetical protein
MYALMATSITIHLSHAFHAQMIVLNVQVKIKKISAKNANKAYTILTMDVIKNVPKVIGVIELPILADVK